jgi:hypothetical protein
MVTAAQIETMPRNDLRENEKRWRRKRLFRERRPRPTARLVPLLLILTALATIGWWLEVPPFDFLVGGVSP